MQLKTLIEEILMGQLSQANMADAVLPHIADLNLITETEDSTKYPRLLGKLVTAINSSLNQIYADLPLALEEVYVDVNPSMDRYLLSIEHAEYAGANYPDQKWIVDTKFAPFRNNIIECINVADEYGAEFHTNDKSATWNVNFPAPNIIQVPFADNGMTLCVTYRAGHPKIPFALSKTIPLDDQGTLGFTTPDMVIELPTFLLNALKCLVAYKYFQSIGSPETAAQAQGNYVEYTSLMQAVKTNQLLHGDYTEIDNLTNEGWV